MTTDLIGDCSRCAALCCLVLAFDKGDRFAFDKPAGLPCPNLIRHACTLHDRLDTEGFRGCRAYDCQGAGQIVTAEVFAGRSWRDDPRLAGPMAEAFHTVREVQDMRGQLRAAEALPLDPAQAAIRVALDRRLSPDWSRTVLAAFDMPAARAAFRGFLDALRASRPTWRAS